MFELKPDFEAVAARYEAWWECAIVDRPLVSISYPVPAVQRVPVPEKTHASERERWLDTEYIVEGAEARLRNTVYFADALPVTFPNLGPEVFSAFYGCEIEYTDRTGWSSPTLEDLSDASLATLRLDREGFYFKKTVEVGDALAAAGKGKFIVGYTDLHAGGDAVAALRDPMALAVDMIEHPREVRSFCDRITDDFLEVYDFFHERFSAAGMPSTTWCPATCRGKFHVPSNDFSCMISAPMFEEVFLPGIQRECQHMDRCIYHLDGPQALQHLEALLEVPEIEAIQWVPGAGRDHWADWIDVYRRIQDKGKALQILSVPAGDIDLLCQSLRPEGVWVSRVEGIVDGDGAAAALAALSRWGVKGG